MAAEPYHLLEGPYNTAAPNYGWTGESDPPERDELAWAVPVQANPIGATDTLTPAQVRQWREQRYLVVDGIWPTELIAQEAAQMEAVYPTPTSYEHAAELKTMSEAPDAVHFGSFPFSDELCPAANQTTLHPRALRAVAQLLGTDELLLTQSGGGAKYGAKGHELPRREGEGFGEVGDQPLHKDYGNNTLLVPAIDSPPEAVCCILYLSSQVEGNGGATGVVPHEAGIYDIEEDAHINFMGPHPRYSLPRGDGDQPGDLYRKEKLVKYTQGTALLYRLDTWCPSSPLRCGRCG